MGLLRTAARAAVAARVVGNVQRRQQLKWDAQDAAAAQAAEQPAAAAQPVPAEPETLLDRLTRLGQLRDAGVLTPEEFEALKSDAIAKDGAA